MRKCLFTILLVSISLGQDVLITKMGTKYKGKMLEAGYYKVQFQPEGMKSAQSVRIENIKSLVLSDGTEVVENGSLIKGDLIKKSKEKDSGVRLANKDDAKRQFSMEEDKSNGLQKFGGLLIGVGGILIASTYQDLSDVDSDDVEKAGDSIRIRGQIGGVLIALGGLFSIVG